MAVQLRPFVDLTVADVMTTDVVTLDPNAKLSDLDQLLELRRVRHMPILDEDDGSLVGIVSQRDLYLNALLRAAGYGSYGGKKLMDDLRVKHVMTDEVLTTTPETSVIQAAQLLRERRIGCLPVVQKGDLVGIVTATDLLGLIADAG